MIPLKAQIGDFVFLIFYEAFWPALSAMADTDGLPGICHSAWKSDAVRIEEEF